MVDKVDADQYSGQPGQMIVVQAHDDFEVTGVNVQITSASGSAVQNPPNSGRWTYTTTQTVSNVTGAQVTATASDRPGNVGTRTVVK